MIRWLSPLVLFALAAAPATAQVVTTEPVAHVSPDGKVEVQFVVGPHAAIGRKAPAGTPGGPGCAVQWLTVQPGGAVPAHVHADADEIVLILQGEGVFTLEGKETTVAGGSAMFVPRGQRHGFIATGEAETVVTQIYDPAGPEARYKAWPRKGAREGMPRDGVPATGR